jgi:hypothetical protein
MKFFAYSMAVLLFAGSLWAQVAPDATDSMKIVRLRAASDTDTIATPPPLRLYDPKLIGGESFVIPGLGQAVTKHFVKAVFFLGAESILGSLAYFWGQSAAADEANAAYYQNFANQESKAVSASRDTAGVAQDSASNVELGRFQHYNAIVARFSGYNYLTWAIGAHIFNVFDAIDASHHFKDNNSRNPTTAFLLALSPGLGLGQIYNGEWSKAGLTIMGQWGLGMMAFNNNRLVTIAQNDYIRLKTPFADSAAEGRRSQVSQQYSNDWSGERYTAFSNRNAFIWYSLFFYGYSLFDATVDAYLHDYSDKMKIKPDLAIAPKSVQFSLSTEF